MTLCFENIGPADRAASRDECFALINRGYSPDVFRAGQWFEISEEEYWYFLECLPPMDYGAGGFSMCEFATGDLTNAFFDFGERYFCLTIQRRNAGDFFAAARAFRLEISAAAPA